MERSIAQRVRIRIYSELPRAMVGNLLVSDKEARFSIEKVVKSFGGVKVYGTQDERDSSYDIFGQEDYVFYDGSILRLEGTSYLDVDSTKGDVAAAIRSLSGFQLAKIKMHCTINLPKRGMPYDPFE